MESSSNLTKKVKQQLAPLLNVPNYHTSEPYHSFLHKKVALPANEIITKQYSPDEKAIIRLVTKEQLMKSQKNLSYVPPKIKNQEFEKYGEEFSVKDFIGFHYADSFDQMVYFRFNNQGWNQSHPHQQKQDAESSSQQGTKYFAGLFIPLQTLASKKFKSQQNIYKALNIQCPQMKGSAGQSFGKNFKGCSLDPMFSSNYYSGNLMAAIRKRPFEYDLILQNDINSRSAQFFNFAVKFIEEGTYTFNVVNLNANFPFYEMGRKIPYYSYHQQSYRTESSETIKSGSGWGYAGKNIKFGKSDLRKENQMFDQNYYCLSFQFKNKDRQQTCMFASAIPYGEIDYERFLNRVLYNRIGQHMKSETVSIGKSLAGADIKAYLFYHRKTKSNTLILKNQANQNTRDSNVRHRTVNLSNLSPTASSHNSTGMFDANKAALGGANLPQSIVFLARQHSGQTVSSFVLEGIVEFLMDNTEFDIFKKNFNFVVIPFMNPDGIKYGNQRVNLAGSDLNNSWKKPSETFEPQTYQVKNYLKRLNQVSPISLLLDLQANSHTLCSYFKSASKVARKDLSNAQNPKLFPFICSKRISQISFQKCEVSPNINDVATPQNSFLGAMTQTFPRALVYEFSLSNYGWKPETGFRKYTQSSQNEEQIYEFTPEVYRTVGKQLISTYLEYVRLCDKNIGIRDRWLKQIQAIKLHLKQSNPFEKDITETWKRETVKLPFQKWAFDHKSPEQLDQQNSGSVNRLISTNARRNTLVTRPAHYLGELRTNAKKRTMPQMRNYESKLSGLVNEDKQNMNMKNGQSNSPNSSTSLTTEHGQQGLKSTILGQFKTSPLSSSIFTPKRRSQILKQISESISEQNPHKKSEGQFLPKGVASNSINPVSDQPSPTKNNQKSLSSKYVDKYRDRAKLKDAIVKFQGMKKFMTATGIGKVGGNAADGNA